MAGHNKNIYRIIAIHEFADTLKEGEYFNIRECVAFLNTRKAAGTNRPHKQTQTDSRQLPMLLRNTGMFTSYGSGDWRFDGVPVSRRNNK
tara:strand:+ start:777 stop:1046 length:270 start_codon:yes stop_codon:yes gene_type:complete